MVKEILIGAGVVAGVVAGVAIGWAVYNYLKNLNESGVSPERAYSDEVTMKDIKEWFEGKIDDHLVGVLAVPTKENLEKWHLDIKANSNMIIQMVYDKEKDEVVNYRELAFSEMSEKVKGLLDNNGGMIVIEK